MNIISSNIFAAYLYSFPSVISGTHVLECFITLQTAFFFLFHFSNFRSLTFWSVGSYLLINSSNDFKKCNFLAVLFPAFLYHLFLYVPKRPCTSLVKVWGMAEPYNYDVTILEFEAPLQLFRI